MWRSFIKVVDESTLFKIVCLKENILSSCSCRVADGAVTIQLPPLIEISKAAPGGRLRARINPSTRVFCPSGVPSTVSILRKKLQKCSVAAIAPRNFTPSLNIDCIQLTSNIHEFQLTITTMNWQKAVKHLMSLTYAQIMKEVQWTMKDEVTEKKSLSFLSFYSGCLSWNLPSGLLCLRISEFIFFFLNIARGNHWPALEFGLWT